MGLLGHHQSDHGLEIVDEVSQNNNNHHKTTTTTTQNNNNNNKDDDDDDDEKQQQETAVRVSGRSEARRVLRTSFNTITAGSANPYLPPWMQSRTHLDDAMPLGEKGKKNKDTCT